MLRLRHSQRQLRLHHLQSRSSAYTAQAWPRECHFCESPSGQTLIELARAQKKGQSNLASRRHDHWAGMLRQYLWHSNRLNNSFISFCESKTKLIKELKWKMCERVWMRQKACKNEKAAQIFKQSEDWNLPSHIIFLPNFHQAISKFPLILNRARNIEHHRR